MPVEREAWAQWRDRVLVWRAGLLLDAEEHPDQRPAVLQLAAGDPLVFLCLFGCVLEPRDRMDIRGHVVPRGWLPAVPFPFQARLIRWFERLLAVLPGSPEAALGRGDGIVEKARGMAFSWTFAAYLAYKWLFDDNFLAGVMSYKEELVERRHSTDTIFFKIEANLGIDPRVPAFRELRVGAEPMPVPIRPPEWLIPTGFDPAIHNTQLLLTHPTKMNVIQGYTTTSRSGTGARLSVLFIDEAAKFANMREVWESASAVTDHRIAGSSADIKFGTGFRDLARWAEEACAKGTAGPSFLRLRPDEHPERDTRWREEILARHSGDEAARLAFAREYELDYAAGHGALIYPQAQEIEPVPLSFDPALHYLDVALDPGIREQTAFHLVRYDPGSGRYGVLATYTNSAQPAEFYATLFLATPLTQRYRYGPEEERIMSWFERYGALIRFWVGDPAGHQRSGAGISFYDAIRRAVAELSDGQRHIAFAAAGSRDFRLFAPRHEALRWLLQRCDFNDTPDVVATLRAIRDYRYKAMPEQESMSAAVAPLRTWGHDRVTALEYYAVHRKLAGDALHLPPRIAPRRVTMSGKPRPVTSVTRHHQGVVTLW